MADRMILNIGQADGKTVKLILEGDKRTSLFGLSVGDEFDGDILDLENTDGYKFKITGGSDDSGVPMRRDIKGSAHKKLLLKGGVGYRPEKKGDRMRKRVRGAEILDDVAQLNLKVIEEGSNPLVDI